MSRVCDPQRDNEGAQRTTHSFTLILSAAEMTDELADKVYSSGKCDDVLVGQSEGRVYLDFDREALSYAEAILSAIDDVETLGFRVIEVLPPGVEAIEAANAFLNARKGGAWTEFLKRVPH